MVENNSTETSKTITNRRPLILDYTYPSDSSRSPQSVAATHDFTSNESKGGAGEGSLSAGGHSAHIPLSSDDLEIHQPIKKSKLETNCSLSQISNTSRHQYTHGNSEVLKNFKNQGNIQSRINLAIQTDKSWLDDLSDSKQRASQQLQPSNKENELMSIRLELDSSQKKSTELESKLVNLSNEIRQTESQLKKSLNITQRLLIEKSELEKKRAQLKCSENNIVLGHYVMQRYGSSFKEVWQTGSKIRNLKKRQKQIVFEREELEKQRKHITKCKTSLNSSIQNIINAQQQNNNNQSNSTNCHSNSSTLLSDLASYQSENKKLMEICELDEILKLKQQSLRKEDNENNLDIERVERERLMHAREIKRLENQENSRFNGYQILHSRYLILSMIGKGGFSEVHKAFDLQEQRYVACKIHQLNREWKEERKVNYIRHAVREYEIHKKLFHPRIVMLYDVFEIDNNTFCTVLEYCDGPDLDFQLKQNHCLPEREARAIIGQVVSALKYLNELPSPIIHYDLKPANILLSLKENYREIASTLLFTKDNIKQSDSEQNSNDEFPQNALNNLLNGNFDSNSTVTPPLDIKITDFGLSKVVERQDDSGPPVIDLTSQGAGTYWYLPPETFSMGNAPPKISSKVDVWSVGIIFYQMLYGQKPFANNMTQTAIIEQNAIQKQAAVDLKFPSKPQCSQEAKNFIKQCLIYDVKYRPDVLTLASHDYLRPSNYKAKSFDAISS